MGYGVSPAAPPPAADGQTPPRVLSPEKVVPFRLTEEAFTSDNKEVKEEEVINISDDDGSADE